MQHISHVIPNAMRQPQPLNGRQLQHSSRSPQPNYGAPALQRAQNRSTITRPNSTGRNVRELPSAYAATANRYPENFVPQRNMPGRSVSITENVPVRFHAPSYSCQEDFISQDYEE